MLRTGLALDVQLLAHVGCRGCDPLPKLHGEEVRAVGSQQTLLHNLTEPFLVRSSHGTGKSLAAPPPLPQGTS